jgi:hypothetical protein
MSANIKASVDGTQAIIGVGGVDQMTVSNLGVVTANSFVGNVTGGTLSGNASSATALAAGSSTARSLANRFGDVVNVLDFGAFNDGTNATATTTAIQNAIAYARNLPNNVYTYKPNIFFPAGDYLINQLVLDSVRGLNFVGEGTVDSVVRRTQIRFSGVGGLEAMLRIRSCAHITFNGILFATNNVESLQSLVLFEANSANVLPPLNRFSNLWVMFYNCVFWVDTAIVNRPTQTVWIKSCGNTIFSKCRIMGGNFTALKIGADSDVSPVDGLTTFANGLSVITDIHDCYITGDIKREKNYSLDIASTSFGVNNTTIGGLANPNPPTSRITKSGGAVCLQETIRNCAWDSTGIENKTGYLIDGGLGISNNLLVTQNQLFGGTTLVRVNAGTARITGNRALGNNISGQRLVEAGTNATNLIIEGNNAQEYLYSQNPEPLLTGNTITYAINTPVAGSTTVTITRASAWPSLPSIGDYITISGVTGATAVNGTYQVTEASNTTFTVKYIVLSVVTGVVGGTAVVNFLPLASLLLDNRTSEFLPVLLTAKLGADVTFSSQGTYFSILSQTFKFYGGYVKINYSATISHGAAVLGNYRSIVQLNGVTVDGSARVTGMTSAGQNGVLAASHILYIDPTDKAVIMDLKIQQASGGSPFGTIKGTAGLAETTFSIELLTS